MNKKILNLLEEKEKFERENCIRNCMEEQLAIIDEIKKNYPTIKVNLKEEQLRVINEIIFDEISKDRNLSDYFNCLAHYISNILHSVVYRKECLDYRAFKKYILFLNKYFDNISLQRITEKMDKYFEENKDFEVIDFNKGRR